jgi:hypothetical protein
VYKPLLERLLRRFIADSSPYVPLLGVSDTRLDNGYYQASYHKEPRLHLVLRLVAQGFVVVLVLGWWGMTTLGSHTLASESDSPAAMAEPIYVGGCPVADTPEKSSEKSSAQGGVGKGGGCSEEGISHPISSRRPGAGLGEHAHRAER